VQFFLNNINRKNVHLFFPIPRRGLIENGDVVKVLRTIGERRAMTFSIIHLVFFYKGVHELAALG
jgi:hypothetical protein